MAIQHACSVSQKNPHLRFSEIFFPNGWKFLNQFFTHLLYIISTLDYKFLFKYLQLSQSYAILSAIIT